MKELLRHMAKMIRLMSLVGLMSLMGCSDDPSPEGQRVSAEVMSCSTGFEEIADRMGTRAWTPPSNYYLYSSMYGENGLFATQKDLAHKSIRAFFTQDTDVQERFFYYRASESKWHMDADLENGSTSSPFQLYGFIPVEDAEGANISPLSGYYSNGAILTINGLSTITPSDVCVIIGAKDGSAEDDDTGSSDDIRVAPGKFDVTFNPGDNASNYIFLLFDHIYSSLRFCFTVDATYYALRRIRLTKLELIAYAGETGGGVKAKYDATITLQKNNTGTSPIVGNISFTPTSGSSDVAFTSLYEWDGTENTENDTDNEVLLAPDTPTNFMGSFVPGVNTTFKLRSTYDVFDTHGNLIRKDCQAENTIDLRQKFEISQTLNGHCYSYTIKVQPTYLYVLSEPDVDNPTVVVN